MKVILNDYIEHLGERGEAVTVKPGYARNYLVPKGLAYPDTPGNRRRYEQDQKRWEEVDLERRSAAEIMAKSLDGVSLSFERRASDKDVLFGSVNAMDILNALTEKGFEIDKRRILLDQPIKALGAFEVNVHIHRDMRVTLPVAVARPGAQDQPAEAEADAVDDAATTAEAPAETDTELE